MKYAFLIPMAMAAMAANSYAQTPRLPLRRQRLHQ